MKLIVTLLLLLSLSTVSAQEKPIAKTSKQSKTEQKAKSKKPVVKKNTTGKSNPNEKGSGMTIDAKDEPRLDGKPEPVAEPVREKQP